MDIVSLYDKMFKYALIYGMTSQEFWFGNPQDYFVYQDAFAEKIKQKHDEYDIVAWLNGRYNLEAFSQVMSDSFKKKGASRKKIFPEQPYSVKDKKKVKKDTPPKDGGKSLAIKILAMAKRLGGTVN